MPTGLTLVRRNVNLYRDPSSGELIVLKKNKQKARRRGGQRARYAGDDEYGDDDAGDDDAGDDDAGDDEYGDDDAGDDDAGDDDAGDDEYGDETGGRRRSRRLARRAGRRMSKGKSVGKKMQKCILTGKKTVTAAGSDSLLIRPQHYFVAKDIVFLGTLAGTTVTNVLFGELVVFNSPDGVDVSLFGTTSFVRDFIAGNKIEPGLDITIQFTTTGAGDVKAQVLGFKPQLRCAY